MTAYKDAGVDIEAGDEAVRGIKALVEGTYIYARGTVLSGIGSFAAAIERPNGEIFGFAVDGVGTKLLIAALLDKHDNVGIDLGAMCFNDLAALGIKPWVFLDYIATEKQIPDRTFRIVKSVVEGCHLAHAALPGGEMAEMPGMYREGHYDLAGFAVGFAGSRDELITGEHIEPGMRVYALPSSGVHSNGFSLIRKVFGIDEKDPDVARNILATPYECLSCTLGDELMRPTRIYVQDIERLRERYDLAGLAHITGGGLVENPPRIMPDGCAARLDLGSWHVPPIFDLTQEAGRVEDTEMLRTFNRGLGILIVTPDEIREDETMLVGEIIAAETAATQFVGL